MSGTSAKTSSTVEIVNITPRRRWSVGEKVRLIEASMAPGQSVSLVARTYGVAPNLLYRWRKQMSEGGKTAIEANDEVVSVAEVKALKKRIRQLERVLGNKTLEVEILKEAVRIGREKKLISRPPMPGTSPAHTRPSQIGQSRQAPRISSLAFCLISFIRISI